LGASLHASRFSLLVVLLPTTVAAQELPKLPDTTGNGIHVLTLAKAPDGALWAGTYGRGIFVLKQGDTTWRQLSRIRDSAAHSISFDFVNALAFGPTGNVWYGTVGNGWGVSADSGKTWRNWELRQLGPEWQYVAPNGIVFRGDTTYVGTADGIKLTWDDGATWRVVTDSFGVKTAKDSIWGLLSNQYVLAIGTGSDGSLWVSHAHGVARSRDGGRTWTDFGRPPADSGVVNRARAFAAADRGRMLVGTEHGVYTYDSTGRVVRRPSDVLALPAVQQILTGAKGLALVASDRGVSPVDRMPSNQSTDDRWLLSLALAPWDSARTVVGTAAGLYTGRAPGSVTMFAGPQRDGREGRGVGVNVGGGGGGGGRGGERGDSGGGRGDVDSARGPRTEAQRRAADSLAKVREDMQRQLQGMAEPDKPKHLWFRRPIAPEDQPHIDQTYRYGSTMGGYFQQHQGVEFNNGNGTPVHAIGKGTVVYAGPAEAGALTVAIRHDTSFKAHDTTYHVYSVYYHNSSLAVTVGQKVQAGDIISRVGNTGRATNDHLHLEVHAAAKDSLPLIVDPDERYPRYTTNPELWIDPLPGTGIVAGQVWDAKKQPVPQARIYGLVKSEPQETPFSFIETYGEHNRGTPLYGEHFAVSDVAPGWYIMSVMVDGKRLLRRIHVLAGKLTWVEFKR
jgi:murein DD-endopeptidase MepM/ murein hydrolase activator NlpD